MVVASLAAAAACAHEEKVEPRASAKMLGRVAFVHVGVVDLLGGRLLADQTVLVEGGVIRSVRSSGAEELPPSTTVIDGSGAFLMPGLADMHVHHTASGAYADAGAPPLFDEDDLLLYVVNGVTTVRGMAGTPADLRFKRRLATGEILGPRYLTSGPPLITGRLDRAVSTAEEAREEVAAQQRAGYDYVKVYCCFSGKNRAVYEAIFEAAEEHGMPVVGHVPFRLPARDAFRLRSIEHLEHLPSFFEVKGGEGERDAVFDQLRDTGTYVTPTLSPFAEHVPLGDASPEDHFAEAHLDYIAPAIYDEEWAALEAGRSIYQDPEQLAGAKEYFELGLRTTRLLHEQGVPLLLGTDSGAFFHIAPGFGVHRELELLVEAGLSPLDALRTATINPARFLGSADSYGSISEGKVADLVLLEANPLTSVSNTRTIRGVLVGEAWFDRAAIDGLLEELRKR